MNDQEFLKVIKKSFDTYIRTHPRSNEKLKILHGKIADDIKKRLKDEYIVNSLNEINGKEKIIKGIYMDKKVDIAIEKDHKILGIIAIKFIMSNYKQNSNNYFESMIGETVNLKAMGIPHYHIVIIPSKVPYFQTKGDISKYEEIDKGHLTKYINLSNDNSNNIYVPDKSLLFLVDIDQPLKAKNKKEYITHFIKHPHHQVKKCSDNYVCGDSVIYNDYNKFIEFVCKKVKETS